MIHIYISINAQRLQLCEGDEILDEYVISSSINGVGYEEGSHCTPMGRFEISEKIGTNAEIGTIFKSRKPVGIWQGEGCDEDMVLTRILRLNGLDPQNANSRDRYIYIHGTNQEHYLGQPKSCGCIRMSNSDVIDLYNRVSEGIPLVVGF